jgi:exopolysaccharide production protein ExoZ
VSDGVKSFASIQHLRAFAALAVVLFHACQWADVDFDIGAAGVDVFFIISGFLMWTITADSRTSPGGFFWSRLTRVAPLYWAATLVTLAIALAAPRLIVQLKPVPSHVLLSLAFVPHLDPVGDPFPLLPPGWTLNYEAVFYLVFTAALGAPREQRLQFVLAALGVLSAIGLVFHPLFPLFANPLMLEFAAGVVLARLGVARSPAPTGIGWSLIALALAGLATLRLLHIHSDIGRWYLWGVPAVLIVGGALSLEARGAWPASQALTRLGDASYAIYLAHWPVIAVAAKLAGDARPAWLFIPLASVAATVVGLVVHAQVEKPLIRLARSLPRRLSLSVP